MRRRGFLRAAAGLSAGGLAALAGCTGRDADPEATDPGDSTTTRTDSTTSAEPTTATGTRTAGEGSPTVEMVTEGDDYYFDPVGLSVDPGTTVSWVISSGTHSTTAYEAGNGPTEVTRIPDGGEAWNSFTLAGKGQSFEVTLETPGTYDYYCIPHEQFGMVGRVVVGEPGGPAESGRPPGGPVPDSDRILDRGTVSYREFAASP